MDTPLAIVARAHALCAAVAQMPSTPSPQHPQVRALASARAARDELPEAVRDTARAELGRLHSCPSLLRCPWGRTGIAVLPPVPARGDAP